MNQITKFSPAIQIHVFPYKSVFFPVLTSRVTCLGADHPSTLHLPPNAALFPFKGHRSRSKVRASGPTGPRRAASRVEFLNRRWTSGHCANVRGPIVRNSVPCVQWGRIQRAGVRPAYHPRPKKEKNNLETRTRKKRA